MLPIPKHRPLDPPVAVPVCRFKVETAKACQTWATERLSSRGGDNSWNSSAINLPQPNSQVFKGSTGSGRITPPDRSPVALATCRRPCTGVSPVLGTWSRLRVLGSVLLGLWRSLPSSPVHGQHALASSWLLSHWPLPPDPGGPSSPGRGGNKQTPPVQVKESRRRVRAHVWPVGYLQGNCVSRSVRPAMRKSKALRLFAWYHWPFP
jgi:hypothetical protein